MIYCLSCTFFHPRTKVNINYIYYNILDISYNNIFIIIGFSKKNNAFTVDMGLGLASTRYIPKGEVIAYFIGDLLVLNGKIYNMRVAAGNTRYMLWMGK